MHTLSPFGGCTTSIGVAAKVCDPFSESSTSINNFWLPRNGTMELSGVPYHRKLRCMPSAMHAIIAIATMICKTQSVIKDV